VKINDGLMELYGVSKAQLYAQAMHNLEMDGYHFCESNKKWSSDVVVSEQHCAEEKTIFLPDSDDIDQAELDNMVAEVNVACVAQEERLADHSYYYDAGTGEMRICAL